MTDQQKRGAAESYGRGQGSSYWGRRGLGLGYRRAGQQAQSYWRAAASYWHRATSIPIIKNKEKNPFRATINGVKALSTILH